ncbi:NAD(P)-binding protein [Polyplosphaeria fusca]|uniref:NAD(P)-binding protein n=1 Tax=Polyplosphaeria fusca TaxID=682080 RepID=A0A9P4QXR2_9PLEO|nr:NAD(P)-binding protein [Polyplosphaeria fusca]
MAEFPTATKAIVTTPPKDGQLSWDLQDVHVREPKEDELLVRLVASGICHTDLVMSMIPPEYGGLYPKVLGHEGGGIVEKVGAKVGHVKAGDLVLLSFDYCGKEECHNCADEAPGYCPEFNQKNIFCEAEHFKKASGESAAGAFFGQSSFAHRTIVKEKSAVNVTDLVKSEEELKLFAPFGCGFQTGAGSITELANAKERDSVVVFGLGGVGMLAVMAAKLRGCRTIIAVDRVQSRLDISSSVGATHTINTKDFANLTGDVVDAIKAIETLGSNFILDTTGVLALIEAGIQALAARGQMILIGVPPPGETLAIDPVTLLGPGKMIRGCIEGDAKPEKYIPQMIQWYREGKLPIEKLIKEYKAGDFAQALGDMHNGSTIKPILIW